MSQVTQPSSWALLLYACAERTSPFYPFFFSSSFSSRNAAGCRTRQAWICTCDYFRLSCLPCPQTVLPCFCQTGHGRQDRLKTCAVGRKLATASHARMTMTVAGLLSRRQESGAFPLSVAPLFELPRGALRHPLCFPLFLPASPASMPIFPCRHSRRHQWVIFVAGAKVKTGLGTQIF